jgi:hypothetical protein
VKPQSLIASSKEAAVAALPRSTNAILCVLRASVVNLRFSTKRAMYPRSKMR